MNDNAYVIPELLPEGAVCNIKDEDSDEFNTLLLAGLGNFALICARAIDAIGGNTTENGRIVPAKIQEFSTALDELDAAKARFRQVGVWSTAHATIWLAIYQHVIDGMVRCAPGEIALQRHLRDNLGLYMDGESIPVRSKNGEGLCDLLIRKNGMDCPMEVKLHKFDENAKKQLRRCMDFYEAPIGYAAAPALTTMLDHDMIFVNVSGWKE